MFHDLDKLVPGDKIKVTRADGSVAVFEVVQVGKYPKDEFPNAKVFGAVDFAGLRLITCGGQFDDATGHYRDNVVVFATLVSSKPAPPVVGADGG